ncbi:protein of unknown function [Nitratireductor aquimarinus]
MMQKLWVWLAQRAIAHNPCLKTKKAGR